MHVKDRNVIVGNAIALLIFAVLSYVGVWHGGMFTPTLVVVAICVGSILGLRRQRPPS